MQHHHTKQYIRIAAHQADPPGLALEDHEDRQIDDRRGERRAGPNERAKRHAVERGVGVCFVRVQAAEGHDEEEGEVDVYDDFEDDEGKHGEFLHADYADA